MTVEVLHADCRDAMARMIAEGRRFHAIVTDPPYGLSFMGAAWDTPDVLAEGTIDAGRSVDSADAARGLARENQKFGAWCGGWARLAFELLPPGGYLLAFGGTRTWHRLAVAVEDAGFEISDTLCWMFGTGFPKSHDAAKAIDKARPEDDAPLRVICRALRGAMDERGLKSSDLTRHFGDCNPRLIDHWAARDTDSQPSLPTRQQWQTLCALFPELATLDGEVSRLEVRKGMPGDAWQTAEIVGEHRGAPAGFGSHRFTIRDALIRLPSAESAEWRGWGTALKTAFEPILVARKPLVGTVAENLLEHGTGALNIDGCRVATDDRLGGGAETGTHARQKTNDGWCRPWMRDEESRAAHATRVRANVEKAEALGRWPANVLHDGSDEVEAAFAAYGNRGAAAPVRGTEPSEPARNVYGKMTRAAGAFHGDSGTAARFFYSAKASSRDRVMQCRACGRHTMGPPSCGCDAEVRTHPTVKPVALMRWLVRLVTPPGGVVLDPFAGSGTTGSAALAEGCSAVLIEQDLDHWNDAMFRVRQGAPPQEGQEGTARRPAAPLADLPLFAEPIAGGEA